MRRLESDPEEVAQMEDALSRAATPMHEQITEEFSSLEVLRGLQAEIDARREAWVMQVESE
jgi:hypothetical protein